MTEPNANESENKRSREDGAGDNGNAEPPAKVVKTEEDAGEGSGDSVPAEEAVAPNNGGTAKESEQSVIDENAKGGTSGEKTQEETQEIKVKIEPNTENDAPNESSADTPKSVDNADANESANAGEAAVINKAEEQQQQQEQQKEAENIETSITTASENTSEDKSQTTTVSESKEPEKSSSPVPKGLPPGLPPVDGDTTPADLNAAAAVSNPESIVEERGEVSALYVGRVIGKGGEMIRDLQARSSCRIDVDQNVPAGQPRVITYRGTRKTVDFAKSLVKMLCAENASEADLPLGDAKREFLVVPAPSVGKIIGRGGEMIRELQSRSQAKIQVDHSGASGLDQSEKQVTITGTDQSVTKAREMVLFLVANPMMDAMQAINMLVEDKVHRGGVWGSGPPYVNLPNQGQNMQPSSAPGAYGYDHGAYAQPGYGAAPDASGYAPPQSSFAATPYQQAPHAYNNSNSSSQFPAGGAVEMEIFYAAKNFMGRIIGQKGVTINDLQRRSTCDIQINQDVPPGQDCEITIRGTRQGIEMVKQMLREIIDIGPNHPYAGGSQGGYTGGAGGHYQHGGYGQPQHAYGYQQPAATATAPYGQGYDPHYQQAAPYAQVAGYQAPGTYGQPQMGYQAQQGYGQPQVAAPNATGWKSATSPDGQIYYYNERTGETQWEKPVGMP